MIFRASRSILPGYLRVAMTDGLLPGDRHFFWDFVRVVLLLPVSR